MSIDLAKRDDVLSALSAVEWDLVIADESDLLAGKRADAFFTLVRNRSAKRGLLLTRLASRFSPPGVSIVQRSFDTTDVTDWDGRPLLLAPTSLAQFVDYRRNAEELGVVKALEDFSRTLKQILPSQQFDANLLVRAASSSLPAADRVARRLLTHLRQATNLLAHGRKLDLPPLAEVEGDILAEASDVTGQAPDQALATVESIRSHITALEALLLKFDALPEDSKLLALERLLGETLQSHRGGHVVIWTGFAATAQYLSTALEALGCPISRIAAWMALDERIATASRFERDGGVLITSGPAVEDLTLPYVDDCVHYDLPADSRTLAQRLGCFLRVGRNKPFRSLVLRDTARGLKWEDEVFEQLVHGKVGS